MRYRAFRTKKDNNFHFQFLTEKGDPILKSQPYTDKNACFNGIKSVMKNAGDAARYEKIEEGGKHFFILKAGNNQEIGRSVAYNSAADADKGIALMKAEGPTAKNNADKGTTTKSQAAASTPPPANTSTEKKKSAASGADDYKPLAYYESNVSVNDNGFQSFAADGEFYFTYNSGGKVILISEGYSSDSSRNNGISSVTKNLPIVNRVKKGVHKNGKHFFRVVAGNHQEIATSRWYDNEGEMDNMIASLQGGGSGAGSAMNVAAGTTKTTKVKAEAPKKEKKAKKPAAERTYLRKGVSYPCSEIVFDTFQSGGNEKYYFVFRTKDEKAILINGDVRGHKTVEELNSTIDEVIKYGPDSKNYLRKETKNGKPYFYIKNKDDKNIARSSLFYKSKEEMEAAIKLLACGAGVGKTTTTAKAAPVAAVPAVPAVPAAKAVDEYLECAAYKGPAEFHKFKHDKSGEFYFAYNDSASKTFLRSEGYTSEKGRDNGIASVIKNAPNDDRWKALNEDGKYFYVLRAGNNQEIARSCPYDSEAAMMNDFAWVRGDRSTIGKGAALVGGVWLSGFAIRGKEQEKQAVMAAEEEARLKAEAEAKAKAEAERLRAEAEAKAKAEEERLRKEAEAKAKADAERRKAEAEARRKAEEEARRKAEEEAIAKAKAEAEARRKTQEEARLKAEAEAKAKAEAEAKKAEAARLAALAAAAAAVPIVTKKVIVEKKEVIKEKEKEDDYLPCKEYEGHTVNDKENNIAFFKHSNGQFYFAVYDKDGKVRLRSEGFEKAETRDEEVSGVIKNINNREMYSTIRRGQYYINILEDKTGREVGRSCLLKDKVAPVPPVAAVAAAAAAPVVIKKVVEKKPEPPKPKEKEDDYLPCEAYANHKVTDKKNNIAQFTHKDGQHYFAMYHKNGKVRLRSEGFTDKNKLKSELDAVIKYHNEKGRYETISRGKYYINVLKDPSGREVGRSCLLKEKVSPIVAVPVAAAAAAIVKETPPPPPKPVVKAEKKKEKERTLITASIVVVERMLWMRRCSTCGSTTSRSCTTTSSSCTC